MIQSTKADAGAPRPSDPGVLGLLNQGVVVVVEHREGRADDSLVREAVRNPKARLKPSVLGIEERIPDVWNRPGRAGGGSRRGWGRGREWNRDQETGVLKSDGVRLLGVAHRTIGRRKRTGSRDRTRRIPARD